MVLAALLLGTAGRASAADFDLVALGVDGGLQNGNLSAWLVRADGEPRYLALDAGTLLSGIDVALQHGAFDDRKPDPALTPAGDVLRNAIAGYFVSHAHLDHVAGLLVDATDDSPKPIYGLASTLAVLSRDYFNWDAWPNFADRGTTPALKQYTLRDEPPGQWFAVDGTSLRAALYPLTHDRVTSSMILLQHGGAYLAYFGDTGADTVQHSDRLQTIWKLLGPLQKRGALKGMLIECSYPDRVDDAHLYGHLNPAWLLRELQRFEQAAGGAGSLRGLDVVVTHIKPSLRRATDPRREIADQLRAGNTLGLHFHFAQQGDLLKLPSAE
ncbi:3',5'-cyclic-nucleotide phosphodiesterase [Solimonas sp. C16B3]|uniref:3',5'-cyclic-nucleotide phosphodiesterase n=2 Tax=Solimonas marina TaxID=2714601 RepID=A0A970B913_9GAMM|nr:3',5'-cyclic-nucleotide phosphodiesterase [Solimonas marina]